MPRPYKDQAETHAYRGPRLQLILAADHTLLRQGLRAILNDESDLAVMGEASSVQDALALVRCLQPDVVIMDVSFENGSGMQAIAALRRECADLRVVMLIGESSSECEGDAAHAGAHACILKDSSIEVLLQAIRMERPAAAHSSGDLRRAFGRRPIGHAGLEGAVAHVTPREREVLIGVARGYSNKRIAVNLGRSIKTVEKHRFAMMHKLGLHNAAAVTRYAIEQGLLDEESRLDEGTVMGRPSRN